MRRCVPGKPQRNACGERFNGKPRRNRLNQTLFPSRRQARAALADQQEFVARPRQPAGHPRQKARALATIVPAGLCGFLLDLCATGDRRCRDEAVELWANSLDSRSTGGENGHDKTCWNE